MKTNFEENPQDQSTCLKPMYSKKWATKRDSRGSISVKSLVHLTGALLQFLFFPQLLPSPLHHCPTNHFEDTLDRYPC